MPSKSFKVKKNVSFSSNKIDGPLFHLVPFFPIFQSLSSLCKTFASVFLSSRERKSEAKCLQGKFFWRRKLLLKNIWISFSLSPFPGFRVKALSSGLFILTQNLSRTDVGKESNTWCLRLDPRNRIWKPFSSPNKNTLATMLLIEHMMAIQWLLSNVTFLFKWQSVLQRSRDLKNSFNPLRICLKLKAMGFVT